MTKIKTIEINTQFEEQYFTDHKGFGYSSVDYGTSTIGLYDEPIRDITDELNRMRGLIEPIMVLNGKEEQLSKIYP